MWLFAVLVAVPIIEIGLFIKVGGLIGLWPTLAIVLLTAAAGTLLLRIQGMSALARLQASLNDGEGDPVTPIAHGAMILVAGLLLLTPGFFTDACGFALLIPPVRAALIRLGAARLAAGVRSGRVVVMGGGAGPGRPGRPGGTAGPRGRAAPGDVIDGEYSEAGDPTDAPSTDDPATPRDPNSPPSGWTKPS